MKIATSGETFPAFFSRNQGLLTGKDQQLLANTCIAIAGAGGDGGLLAERLIRLGIGKILLADPEVFEPANINRQFASNANSMGQNKAIAVARELRLINPAAEIQVYTHGITRENIAAFVGQADIVVDEIEYSLPTLSVLLHQEARSQNKHVFMGANIGWGASMFCFSPDALSFEEHFEYCEEKGTINALKYLKEIPSYFSQETREAILSGEMHMPTIAPAVSLVAAMMSTAIVLFITKKQLPVLAPEFICFDLFEDSLRKAS